MNDKTQIKLLIKVDLNANAISPVVSVLDREKWRERYKCTDIRIQWKP